MLFVLAAVIPPPDVEELKAHLKACQLRTAIQTHIDAVTGIVPVSTTTVGKNQFTEYAIPAVNSYGRSIVQGDRIWIPSAGELNTGQGDEIMRLSTSGHYVSYALPRGDCGLRTLRATNDGFWFTRTQGPSLGHLALNGDFSERPVDGSVVDVDLDGTPYGSLIEYGLNGTRWSATYASGIVEWHTPLTVAVHRAHFTPRTTTSGIVPDLHGAWLARNEDEIVYIDDAGQIASEMHVPRACVIYSLTQAAGSIFFSCLPLRSRTIGRMALSGALTMIDLPYPYDPTPVRIFGDSQGLWIVDFHRVFRLNITESSPFTWNGRKLKGRQPADRRHP